MHALQRHDGDPRDDSEVIDRIGGTMAVARLCEVSSQAVSQWRRYGIPKPRRMFMQLARPEAFDATRRAAEMEAA